MEGRQCLKVIVTLLHYSVFGTLQQMCGVEWQYRSLEYRVHGHQVTTRTSETSLPTGFATLTTAFRRATTVCRGSTRRVKAARAAASAPSSLVQAATRARTSATSTTGVRPSRNLPTSTGTAKLGTICLPAYDAFVDITNADAVRKWKTLDGNRICWVDKNCAWWWGMNHCPFPSFLFKVALKQTFILCMWKYISVVSMQLKTLAWWPLVGKTLKCGQFLTSVRKCQGSVRGMGVHT